MPPSSFHILITENDDDSSNDDSSDDDTSDKDKDAATTATDKDSAEANKDDAGANNARFLCPKLFQRRRAPPPGDGRRPLRNLHGGDHSP